MTTFFSGPRDGQLDKNLQVAALMAVNFFSKKLNIHRLRTNIHVRFHHNLYVDNSHSEGLCESVDPRSFIIDIALFGNWMSTLAHELVHVKQQFKGELKEMDGKSKRWKDEIHIGIMSDSKVSAEKVRALIPENALLKMYLFQIIWNCLGKSKLMQCKKLY